MRKYAQTWEYGEAIPFIVDAKEEYLTFYSPIFGWCDSTGGAISAVVDELGDYSFNCGKPGDAFLIFK